MPELKGSVDILRPVEEVFAYLAEPRNNLEWEAGVVEMELTTEGPLAVGSKGRRLEKQMGTDEGTWEITEHVQNETLSMSFESGRFTGSGGYNLEATDAGTSAAARYRRSNASAIGDRHWLPVHSSRMSMWMTPDCSDGPCRPS